MSSMDEAEDNSDSGFLADSQSTLGLRVQISGTHNEEFLNEYKYILVSNNNDAWQFNDDEFEDFDEDEEYQGRVLTRYFAAVRSKGFTALYILRFDLDYSSIESNGEDGLKWKFSQKDAGFYGEGGWIGVRAF